MPTSTDTPAVTPDAPLLTAEHPTPCGHVVTVATLNLPKSLNSLTTELVQALDAALAGWADDPQVACVFLQGAGEKAFCAGGDVRGIRQGIVSAGPDGPVPNPEALAFFSAEYRLDYRIHTYPKPIVCWAGGIVMGGGVGLMAGATHRVVTETTRLAMPEITIGLFPDVGGSFFLSRLPGGQGLYLGLTGATLNAADGLLVRLATRALAAADREAVISALIRADWTQGPFATVAGDVLDAFATPALAPGNLAVNAPDIAALTAGATDGDVIEAILADQSPDPWRQKATASLRAGSPTTACLVPELQRRAAHLLLADVFRMELTVAVQCAAHPDFPEGVRALLVDKDMRPRWSPASVGDVTPEWINEHFAEPGWPGGEHPLADLGVEPGPGPA